jgi:hypothetical protein
MLALALVMMIIAGTIGAATLYGATAAQTTVYGKVTAVSGKKVTLALGTMPSGRSSKPTGSKPTSSKKTSSKPASSKTSSGFRRGNWGGGRAFTFNLKLNGKKQTITVSDTGILTKFGGRRGFASSSKPAKTSSKPAKTKSPSKPSVPSVKASMSDIKVGGILKVIYTTSNKKLVSVTILS